MHLKKTLFFLTIFSFIQLHYSQELRVIDNKGTIQKINNITSANTTPTNPVQGDVWFDTANNLTKIYNGSIWLNLGGVNTNFNIVNVAGTDYLRITDSGGNRDIALTNLSHSGTAGSLFFANTDGKPTENNSQLFWDNTNNRLGIGATTPNNKLDVNGAIRAKGILNSNGIVNEPSYRFTDDINTGLFSPAQDQIGFTAGGIEALNISELTNVTKVTVNQTLELNGALLDVNNDSGSAGQVLSSTATGTDWVAPNNAQLAYVKTITGNYTLLASDNAYVFNVDSASDVTLTVPSGLPIGFNISVYQIGNGIVTFTGAGATLKNRLSRFKTAGKDAGVGIIATGTNIFHLTGDLKL